jgi:cell division protease FtsH
MKKSIDASVKKIADEGYAAALRIVEENRTAMDKVVEALMEEETMTGDRFREILAKYAEIPAEHMAAVARNKAPDAELIAA